MKIIITSFLLALVCLYSNNLSFAQQEIVIADKLTGSDIEGALLAGKISSNCGMRGFPEAGATDLNPDTIIIKTIYHAAGGAKIYFMGRFKEIFHAGEIAVLCEAYLERLESGEWFDPQNGRILTK